MSIFCGSNVVRHLSIALSWFFWKKSHKGRLDKNVTQKKRIEILIVFEEVNFFLNSLIAFFHPRVANSYDARLTPRYSHSPTTASSSIRVHWTIDLATEFFNSSREWCNFFLSKRVILERELQVRKTFSWEDIWAAKETWEGKARNSMETAGIRNKCLLITHSVQEFLTKCIAQSHHSQGKSS